MVGQRQYLKFYGIDYNDWEESFGSFVNHHKILTQNYISDGVSTEATTQAHGEHKFLYPHHLERTYFIEGRIEGNIVVSTEGTTGDINSYRVSVCKVHEDSTETELASTGWVSVNVTLEWDSEYNIGDETVFHFWIDCWKEQELSDLERLYIKIQIDSDASIILYHSNDSKWEDVWVEIPFKM